MGDWCIGHSRETSSLIMDVAIATPYGLTPSQKDLDIELCRRIEEKILPNLVLILNRYHQTNYSLRFWKIVLGHWLRRYIETIFNRISSLQQCIDNYKISGLTVLADVNYILAGKDSWSFIEKTSDDYWNKAIEYRIISKIPKIPFPVEVLEIQQTKDPQKIEVIKQTLFNEKNIKLVISKTIAKTLNLFLRQSDGLILTSYLPRSEEVKLYFRLFQIPQRWIREPLEFNENVNVELRQNLTRQINVVQDNLKELIIFELLFEVIPICYLEGFSTLIEHLDKLGWPENPKFIFTSNSFDTDEAFKVWTGIKTELGSKYVVGQHGGMYGTDRWFQSTIEETTSDEFLTWGWNNGLPNHTPAFVLKTKKSKRISGNGGQILLIQKFDMVRDRTWDELSTFNNYLINQMKFINCLNSETRGSILLRLHPQVKYSLHDEISWWKNYSSEFQIEYGTKPIFELFDKCVLVVHTYDSTGLLESLSLNLPTIAFWEDGFDHLVDSAIPSYKLLEEVGILHFTPESAAKKLNEISSDIEGWWDSAPLQRARKEFCAKYAVHENNKSKKLKPILMP